MSLMFAARTSPSIHRMLFAMVCMMGLLGPGWADKLPTATQAAKPPGKASALMIDPALQVKLTVDFKAPKAQDIVDRLRAETKMDLTLADNIDRGQPALGSLSCRNVPAWIIMEELAKSKIIQGKWERNGNGYLLTSPLPPPALANADSPSPAGAAQLGLQYFLFAIPLAAVFGILLLIRYRRRSQQTAAAKKQPTVPRLRSSV